MGYSMAGKMERFCLCRLCVFAENVWFQNGTGHCSELQVAIDASKLLDVASAIKHGHALPWTKLRRYWAENPITNVGQFGLLVTTWAGFLSVREALYVSPVLWNVLCMGLPNLLGALGCLSIWL